MSHSPEVQPVVASSRPQQQVCGSVEEILVNGDLYSRPLRMPNLESESQALRTLAREMANSPKQMPDTLLQLAVELCHAGTAGLSLIETLPAGEQIFRWTNLAGTLKDHVGGFTPRNFSPCGVSLDRNSPELFSYPARYFRYLNDVPIPIVEALVVPLVGDSPMGTIWILSHEEGKCFDCEDVRIMTSLAEFTSSALHMIRLLNAEHSAWQDAKAEIERRTAELQEQVAERDRAQKHLRDLTSRLLNLQDDEHRKLARELHDSVGQLLAAMSMNQATALAAKGLDPVVVGAISENARLVEQVSVEIRTISHLLHPPMLDEVGLASGIRLYLEGFAERSHMTVDLQLAEDFGRLSPEMEIALFRIVQECLTNVHRHSESKTATIRIGRSADEIWLEVADGGRGMPQETILEIEAGRTSGLGLRGMRERIRQLGGILKISSNGTGTVVATRLPVGPGSVHATN
jgi:signal transduction histidine kinase